MRSIFAILLLGLLCGCGTSRKAVAEPSGTFPTPTPLTVEQQRKYDYFFLEGVRLKAIERYAEAFEMFNHALEVAPDAPSALFEIAQYYEFLGQPAKSLEVLQKAVAYAPDNYWYSQTLAQLYQQQNKMDESIALLEAMSVRFPSKDEPLLVLIDMYSKQNNYDQLIAALDRLEQKQGKSEQISLEKFKVYLKKEDEKAAFGEIDKLVDEYPLDLRYQTIRGDLYLQYGKKEEARQAYEKVLEKEPGNPMTQISMASYYDAINDSVAYNRQIDTILLNKEIPAEIKLNLLRQQIAGAENVRKDSAEVIAMFDRIIQLDNEDTLIPMLYTQYLLSKNMEEQSIPVLEHILKLDPENSAARMMLLGSAIRRDDPEWIVRICKPGVEETPDKIEFYFYLGIAYYQLERYEEALSTYQGALNHISENTDKAIVSDLYSMIGDIRHTLGKKTEAFAAYDSALEYNPSNIGALNNYAYYLSVERVDLDKAEQMSYKTVKAEPGNATYLDTYAWILFEKGDYVQARLFIDDALKNGGEESDVIVEHAGDIYYMSGDVEGAVKLWKQAKEMGSESKTIDRKIRTKKFIPETK